MKKLYFISIALSVVALSACRSGNEAATLPAQEVVEEVAQQEDTALEQVAVEPSEEELAAEEAERLAAARRAAAQRAKQIKATAGEADALAQDAAAYAKAAAESAELAAKYAAAIAALGCDCGVADAQVAADAKVAACDEAGKAAAAAQACAAAKTVKVAQNAKADAVAACTAAQAQAQAAQEAADRLAQALAAAEKAAAEKAEQERLAAEAAAKAEAERLAAEAAAKAEAERLAAEAAARLKKQIKPLYLQLQGGVNYLASEGGRAPVFGHNGLVGGEAAIVLGGELSRVWGLRGGIGYGYNRTRNLNDLSGVSSLPFHSVEAFFGTTIDWLDINANRQNFNWDFYSFVDLAYLCTLPRPAFEPAMSSAVSHNGGLRLGLHVGRKLTERFALGLEGAIMFMTDQFSGKTGSVMADGRGTLNVTCTWTIGK